MKKGIKIELLGIGVILLGFALGSFNFLDWVLGVIGFLVIVVGVFLKDNDK